MNNPDAERAFAQEHLDVDEREWLVTNGLGGYASGTVSGKITRRFHGWLIAALPAPQGRTMMLNKLAEVVEVGTKKVRLSVPSEARSSATAGLPLAPLHSFRLDQGLPVWTYAIGGALLERRAWMTHGQNTTYIVYHLQRGAAAPLRLELEPWVNFRPHEGPVDAKPEGPYALTVVGTRFEIGAPGLTAALRLRVVGEEASFAIDNSRVKQMHYPLEDSRGYDADGGLYSIGFFRVTLVAGGTASLQATAEAWEATALLDADGAAACETTRRSRLIHRAGAVVKDDMDARLVFAADQFLVTPVGRTADRARARARGDDVRTVIAGYPWFTDWGRDTMISLEGLALVTGRHEEAGYILRTFAHFVRDGLIPNMFPERGNAGLYHTADATLWFFHAIDRYFAYTRRRLHPRGAPAHAPRDRRLPRTGHRLRDRRRPDRRTAPPGRGWLPAHLDGRKARRARRHASPRQGRRDQRPLLQRSPPARGLDAEVRARPDARVRRRRGPPAHLVQRALLERRGWIPLRCRGLRGRRRRPCLPPEPASRRRAPERGPRGGPVGGRRRSGEGEAAHARRAQLPFPR